MPVPLSVKTMIGKRARHPNMHRKMRGNRSTNVATPELPKGQSAGITFACILHLANITNQFTRHPAHVRWVFAHFEPHKLREYSFASSESQALSPTAAWRMRNHCSIGPLSGLRRLRLSIAF